MAIMKQLWDNSEFADLNISTQNLRDQVARIEKTLKSAGSTIREESNTANDLLQSNVDNQETSSEGEGGRGEGGYNSSSSNLDAIFS